MSLRWRHEGWRKLYIREEGTFALLPLYTRALAGELLKICDSAGRIDCMGKEPWAAVAWRLGATRGDRRLLKRDLEALLTDGYLRRDPTTGDLVIRNFLEAHPHLATAMEGVDRVPVAEVGEGASVVELTGAGAVQPLAPAATIPGADGAQLGLFAWAPPAATTTRCDHDTTTTTPRNSTQPSEIVEVASEDQRREDQSQREKAPPSPSRTMEGDEVGARRSAQRLAELHEQLRAEACADLGAVHVALPLADLTSRIAALLREGWSEDALEMAFGATFHEATRKRTLVYFNGADNLKPDALRRAIARAPLRRAPVKRPTSAAVDDPARSVGGEVPVGDLEAVWRGMGLDDATIGALRARVGG